MVSFGSVDNPAVAKALDNLASSLQKENEARYRVGVDLAIGQDKSVRQHADGRVDYWEDGKWVPQR